MNRRTMLGCLLTSWLGASVVRAAAAETVAVPGSAIRYPSTIAFPTQGGTVNMVLTGTALRRKLIVNVYGIASYIPEGTKVRTAADLVAADVTKWLFIVMERDLEGESLADGFRTAFKDAHGDGAYADSIGQLIAFFSKITVKKGDGIILTHIPKQGLHINVGNRDQKMIAEPAFAKAVWEIYLGDKPLTDSIKSGLISRL
ncbi:chalcone isomerase family protein [Tuwongella immobilis]|uniref:Chalcone isomerase domain-containing protein n=1 Tax=Tuwongella immobilis TaxID=692036 RepID=A0A6C2YQK4_9BACT|nr:chalcone isomerase family protein [Tuwongella immobilis]VIP03439.1 membrane protein : Chalcone-flavanone isomerase OS=Singulisphaera acidiphila (strain ATCC BAA-1392 / DSM 18658 / VKM B-2454 / MOB10) GN=Sinac_0769 PE=4 SV=1: Chalcone [Tuwongella immobilis]VTS04250.1 membrane protein : Chalcone-flavanone isomerase OS=Singulisphaera acidiphila (strain ATCC BAA-1392 / DSM 18658 / VKM B-2454 / MOB10) GN=Sinac_0769 PE=4 SV=1: Chalcone [Tuwongella immobilis]